MTLIPNTSDSVSSRLWECDLSVWRGGPICTKGKAQELWALVRVNCFWFLKNPQRTKPLLALLLRQIQWNWQITCTPASASDDGWSEARLSWYHGMEHFWTLCVCDMCLLLWLSFCVRVMSLCLCVCVYLNSCVSLHTWTHVYACVIDVWWSEDNLECRIWCFLPLAWDGLSVI